MSSASRPGHTITTPAAGGAARAPSTPQEGLSLPGFLDPVADSQRAFRSLLDAFAHPGSIHTVGATLNPPAPLRRATAAVLLALVDADAPLWIAPEFEPARGWLVFHCGAALTASPNQARFVLVAALPELDTLACGTDEAPEDGATVLLQLAALDGGGETMRLAGPGLRTPATFAPQGLGENFVEAWSANRGLSPCGIDLVLCADDQLAALPRSVSVSVSVTVPAAVGDT